MDRNAVFEVISGGLCSKKANKTEPIDVLQKRLDTLHDRILRMAAKGDVDDYPLEIEHLLMHVVAFMSIAWSVDQYKANVDSGMRIIKNKVEFLSKKLMMIEDASGMDVGFEWYESCRNHFDFANIFFDGKMGLIFPRHFSA